MQKYHYGGGLLQKELICDIFGKALGSSKRGAKTKFLGCAEQVS